MKPFTTLAIFVFALVALLQLLRIALRWEVTIDGFLIPLWASAIVSFIAALLAFNLRREMRTRN